MSVRVPQASVPEIMQEPELRVVKLPTDKQREWSEAALKVSNVKSVSTINCELITEIGTEFTEDDGRKRYKFHELIDILHRELAENSTIDTIKQNLMTNWARDIQTMHNYHLILNRNNSLAMQQLSSSSSSRCKTLRYYSNSSNRTGEAGGVSRRQVLDFRTQAFDVSGISSELPHHLRNMKREECRLKSFDFGEKFELARRFISVEELAADGFYYLLQSDHVKCAFCKGVLKDWKVGERPDEEHRKHFSTCPFVLHVDVGNEPIADKYSSCKVSQQCTEPNELHVQQDLRIGSPSLPATLLAALKMFEHKESIAQLALGQLTSTCRSDLIEEETLAKGHLLTEIWQQTLHHNFSHPLESAPAAAVAAAVADDAATNLKALRVKQQQQLAAGQLQFKHPSMSSFIRRKLSLRSLPPSVAQLPQQPLYLLAKAGVCFVQNELCCYCCGLQFASWPVGENPWLLHARYSPRCAHVLLNRGQQFVLSVRQALPPVAKQQLQQEQQQQQQQQKVYQRTEIESPYLSFRTEPRDIKARIDLSHNRLMSALGFSATEVKVVIELRLRAIGDDFASNQLLLQALLKQRRIIKQRNQNAEEYYQEKVQLHQQIQSQPPRSRDVQDWKTCKVCMDKEVNIVIIDCGHLCCCSDCVKNLRTCPMCRAAIRATLVLKD